MRFVERKLCAIGGLAFALALAGCGGPRLALKRARSENSIAAYEQFLARYPDSPPYADQARQGIARLREAGEKLRAAKSAKVTCCFFATPYQKEAEEVVAAQGWKVERDRAELAVKVTISAGQTFHTKVTMVVHSGGGASWSQVASPVGGAGVQFLDLLITSETDGQELYRGGFAFAGSPVHSLRFAFLQMWTKLGVPR